MVYEQWLRNRPTLFAGDFNHSCVWDKPGRGRRNHAATVAAAEAAGLFSSYHRWFDVAQGAEPSPTLYGKTRALDGPSYHVDYAFLPDVWAAGVRNVQVGEHADWVGNGLSDHVPLIVDLELPVT